MPSIKWIGVYPSEIEPLNLVKLPLTGRDNKKINDLMKRPYINGTDSDDEFAHQLSIAKALNAKVEIEGLYDIMSDNYLIDDYLTNKIGLHLQHV